MLFVEFAVWPGHAGVDLNDLNWTRLERNFETHEQADEEAFELSCLNHSHTYRVVEEVMNGYETVPLGVECPTCNHKLELAEGGREHLVQCPVCDAEPGEGSTPADALQSWYAKQPEARYLPSELANFVLPRHPWVVEVDGYPFATLTLAEEYAKRTGHPIMCRLASSQKAANQ